ncbi:MAG TPA: TadE/TadG family type IV pilus assembly protein [Candidatus Dormibacteraeota bacterium]|jgi:hypothetical protein|nr:TadE/TadG family type IV pilus assembly protein [Candidatus Dormibacteraeota bacterium]
MLKPRGRRQQQGQTIVLFALAAVVLFGVAAIAVDTGLAMADRRGLQAVVDSASLAGAREYYTLGAAATASNAHYVAMLYLAKALKGSVPQSCTFLSCGNALTLTGGYTFTFVDGPGTLDITATHTLTALFAPAGKLGSNGITVGTGARAKAPAAVTGTAAGYAVFVSGGDFQLSGGGSNAPSGDVSGNIYAAGNIGNGQGQQGHDEGGNGHSLRIPTQPTDANGNVCQPASTTHLDTTNSSISGSITWVRNGNGPASGTTNVRISPAKTDPYAGVAAPVPAVNTTYTSSWQALVANVWQPGTYDGFFPDRSHLMAPGVYVVKNVEGGDEGSTMQVGGNAVPGTVGTADKAGAVTIVLDSSDQADLDLSNTTLNGLDDDGIGVRDALGTHNFAIYAPTYSGAVNVDNSNITGIVDLNKADLGSEGNSSFHFYGSVVFKSVSISGGGNGTQAFSYVCSLQAVLAPSSGSYGLQR